MKNNSLRKHKLLVTISVLFTVLIVVFGLFFRQFIYWQTSKMLLEESKRQFSEIENTLTLDFIKTQSVVAQTVHLLAKTGVTTAKTLEKRLQFVPLFQAALEQEQQLSGLQVGYDTGDYFIVRPIDDETTRRQFSAPMEAALVIDNITTENDGKRYLQRLWYSESLTELGRSVPEINDYDPRVRPWFQMALASEKEVSTRPYVFHFVQQMGITIGYMSPSAGAVIAGDVTLVHLSETLAKYQQTPRSEVILLEKMEENFWVTAYKDPKSMIAKDGNIYRRSHAGELGSPILEFAATQPNLLEPFFTLEYVGERWLGSTKNLTLPSSNSLYLVMLSPEDELLTEARKLQAQALKFTLIMILLTIPFTWYLAKKISRPMQMLAKDAQRISHFDFADTKDRSSSIKEVDELGLAMSMMESTIGQFISLISSLASEQDFDKLLHSITEETMSVSHANAACAYLVNDKRGILKPGSVQLRGKGDLDPQALPEYELEGDAEIIRILNEGKRFITLQKEGSAFDQITQTLGLHSMTVVALPLKNRQQEAIGLLCLFYDEESKIASEEQRGRLAFVEALSGFAAVTLESRKMLRMQKELLESFIKLLAGAIDSKSPYTGGHCQRVPVLTKLLAQKACDSAEEPFAGFGLSDEQWEEIHIASWLHDCGKVTTPEYVVDKATKLETIYDRIHEVRMRFEVLKRDAHISYWKRVARGGDREQLWTQLEAEWALLDEEFAFVAECNLGGEFMAEAKVERLQEIASRSWQRTIDDRLGISWEEVQRKERLPIQELPVSEQLLADRNDHLFIRSGKYQLQKENDYGFVLDVPEYLYNRGELYNLSVARGTLTDEERYQINDHIVQTIIMLKQLPFPSHLVGVPDIAGGHHEKIDGTGYPRRLVGEHMSLPAKMMVIADIFEALTASDRPYKKAKKLSDAIKIMGFMEKDNHIDSNLFKLFLSSGAYLEYAREYLLPDQVDEVDISQYLES